MISGFDRGEQRKRLRKPLGEDLLLVFIKSDEPLSFHVRAINLTTKKLIAEKFFIQHKKQNKIQLRLPYDDMLVGVHIKSVNNNQKFFTKIVLQSDMVYEMLTGRKPLSKLEFWKGGGGLAQQQSTPTPTDGNFLKQADSDFLVTQTDGSYIIINS